MPAATAAPEVTTTTTTTVAAADSAPQQPPQPPQQQPPNAPATMDGTNSASTTPYTVLAAAADDDEAPAAPPAGPATAGTTTGVSAASGSGMNGGDPLLKDVDPKRDLPTPWQLWKFIFGELLFGNPDVRDLVWVNLAVHLVVWSVFTVLLWAFFLKWLPFTWRNKVLYFTSMAAFSSASDTAGLVLCAGVLIRLRDRSREPGIIEVFRRVLAFRRVTSLMAMAAICTFVRLIHITANNLVPLCGVFCIPALIRHCTLRRKGVAWVESLDMTLPVMIGRRLGYPTGRTQAIDYFLTRWGRDPWPLVRTDNVIVPAFLLLIFAVILPLFLVGMKLRSQYLMAGGLTASIATLCFVQFARPLTANVYCFAAYLYTEHGRNDIFGDRWPKLAPNAFRCLHKEREVKKAIKAAMGEEGEGGWVTLDTDAVIDAEVAEGRAERWGRMKEEQQRREQELEKEKEKQQRLLEEGKLGGSEGLIK